MDFQVAEPYIRGQSAQASQSRVMTNPSAFGATGVPAESQ